MSFPDKTQRIVGGIGSEVVVGAAAFDLVARNKRCYAITVRTQGTIIAAINIQNPGQAAPVAFVPTWATIVLNQGDYFVSDFPITSITLTAATDSVTLHCDQPQTIL